MGHVDVLVPLDDRHRDLAHLIRRVPLRYHPSFWALVFPIGMYGAATFRMHAAIELDALEWLPKVTLGFALLAWTATTVGLVTSWRPAALRR